MVGVRPDVPAVDRILDYLVPAAWAPRVGVGTIVRIPLQGRRVRGWVCELGRTPPSGIALRAVTAVSGIGPGADLIDLADWAAQRWAARPLTFLRAATPHRIVDRLPAPPAGIRPGSPSGAVAELPVPPRPALAAGRALAADALAAMEAEGGASLVRTIRWAPGSERLGLALAAVERGPALLLAPSQHDADVLARALRDGGHWIARHPDDWAAGAAGATVIGSRAAVWAPVADLRTVVVFDEHDERYQDERVPMWHARDVALERARRCGASVLLVSPLPSPEAAHAAPLLTGPRSVERAGWPPTTVLDRRGADPRQGLYADEVVAALRSEGRIAVVYNRTGRARLLACTRCGELCRCEECGAAMRSVQPPETSPVPTVDGAGAALSPSPVGVRSHRAVTGAGSVQWLRCSEHGHERPAVCQLCGATRLAVLRPGVGRVREDVEALVGEPVAELSGAARGRARRAGPAVQGADDPVAAGATVPDPATARVVVGTVALLHRLRRADAVVFLDLDQELLAPRFRAAERALGMLALAARLVGGRRRAGRLVVQTRQPDHEVIRAVLHADPGLWASVEEERRRALLLPPFSALAAVSGPGAAAYAAGARAAGLAVSGPVEDTFLVRAADAASLATGLCAVVGPADSVRVVVDPPDI